MKKSSVLMAVLFSLFTLSDWLLSATWYVPNPIPSIQAGIDSSSTGDTILVAPGIYLENINFEGKAIQVASSAGYIGTTIDGNYAGYVVSFNHGEGQNSLINGFTIKHGSYYGIYMSTNSSPKIENCYFVDNQQYHICSIAPQYAANIIDSSLSHNIFIKRADNQYNAFPIRTGTITQSTTWPVPPDSFCYLVIEDHDIVVQGASNPTLTLQPGTVIKFLDQSVLEIGGDSNGQFGKLLADGVTFTSSYDDTLGDALGAGGGYAPSPGNWYGITFRAYADDASIMENCLVRYSGESSTYGGAISFFSCSPHFDANTLTQNRYCGLYVDSQNGGNNVRGSYFVNNETYHVKLHPGSVDSIVTNNSFVANSNGWYNAIAIIEGNNSSVISESTTWPVPPDSFCYLVIEDHDIVVQGASNPTLTLQPGTVIKFLDQSVLEIGGDSNGQFGKLLADGVTFTSSYDDTLGDALGAGGGYAPSPGNWYGITFRAYADPASLFSNCIINYSGRASSYGGSVSLHSAEIDITNCTISNSASSGIYTTGYIFPNIMGCILSDNIIGLSCANNSDPEIHHCNISGNAQYGVRNLHLNFPIEASYNSWGSPSGPYHAVSNPYGTGDAVSDSVNFAPWMFGGEGAIAGFIIEADQSAPIQGALVKALLQGVEVLNAITGPDGAYALPDLPGGVYNLQVTKEGYHTQERSGIYVYDGQQTTVDFYLVPNPIDQGNPLRERLLALADAVYDYCEGNRELTAALIGQGHHFLANYQNGSELETQADIYRALLNGNLQNAASLLTGTDVSDPAMLLLKVGFLQAKWMAAQDLQAQVDALLDSEYSELDLNQMIQLQEQIYYDNTHIDIDYRGIDLAYADLGGFLSSQVIAINIPTALPEGYDINGQIEKINALINRIKSCTVNSSTSNSHVVPISYHQFGECSFQFDQLAYLGKPSTYSSYYYGIMNQYQQRQIATSYVSLICDATVPLGTAGMMLGVIPGGQVASAVFLASSLGCMGIDAIDFWQEQTEVHAIQNFCSDLGASWSDDNNQLVSFYLRTLEDIEESLTNPQEFTCTGDVILSDFEVPDACPNSGENYATVSSTIDLDLAIPGTAGRAYVWVDVYIIGLIGNRQFYNGYPAGFYDVQSDISIPFSFDIPTNDIVGSRYSADVHILTPGHGEQTASCDFFVRPQWICFLQDLDLKELISNGFVHQGQEIASTWSPDPGGLLAKIALSYPGSKIDLHIYDSDSNHVGIDYQSGQIDTEIPGSFFFDDSAGYAYVQIQNPVSQNFQIVVKGIDVPDSEYFSISTYTEMPHSAALSTSSQSNFLAGQVGTTVQDTIVIFEAGGHEPVSDISFNTQDLFDSTGALIPGSNLTFDIGTGYIAPRDTLKVPYSISIPDSIPEGSYTGYFDVVSSANSIQFFLKVNIISPGFEYFPGDANMYNGAWPPAVIGSDVTYLVNYFRGMPTNPACIINDYYCAADVNADCRVIGSDVTRLVNFFRGLGIIEPCPDYPPAWQTPSDCPEDAPADWPNCEITSAGKNDVGSIIK